MLNHSQNIHPKVQQFLDTLGNQIHTENEAAAIKTEMFDHIESAKEDYFDGGYSESDAISYALKDMGDPSEIGYAFTNYTAMRKRNRIRLTLKSVGILGLLTLFCAIVYSDYRANPSEFESIELVTPFSFLAIYYYMFKASMFLRADRTLKNLDVDVKPLLIIWPVKKPIETEHKLLALIFSPIFIVFGWLFLHESLIEGTLLSGTLFLAVLLACIGLVFYSEAFRIPKTIIVEDGIVLKGNLLSWTAINHFKWQEVKTKKGRYYKLKLTGHKQIPVGKTIVLSEKQKPFVAQLLSERI